MKPFLKIELLFHIFEKKFGSVPFFYRTDYAGEDDKVVPIRETKEENGIDIEVTKFCGVFQNVGSSICKTLFLGKAVGGKLTTTPESLEVGFSLNLWFNCSSYHMNKQKNTPYYLCRTQIARGVYSHSKLFFFFVSYYFPYHLIHR